MEISEDIQDILTEVIHMGVGKAAGSLYELIGRRIVLSVPEAHVFNREELKRYLKKHHTGEKYVHVTQHFGGVLEGEGIVSFPILSGKILVDNLLENNKACMSELVSFHQNEPYNLDIHARPIFHNPLLHLQTLEDSIHPIQDMHSLFAHTNQKIYFASLQDTNSF